MSSFQPWMATAAIIFIMQMFMAVNTHPLADKIDRLPGQPKVNFQQFSGYITVDQKQGRALFYYFVEAEKDPHSKPLVLWLNGGPGCSSVGAGGFTEHGPFIPFDGVNLIKNEYSWNKEANMLYLESPAGVGFSYSTNKSFYVGVGDKATARDSLVFLQRWFQKFPEYKNREFYISGESYAGHYVPQLAKLIIDSKANFNLKGISLGNPLLDFVTDMDSVIDFRWSHGLISDFAYELITTACNYSQFLKEVLIENRRSLSPGCALVSEILNQELTEFVDVYDVLAKYCLSSINDQSPKKIPYLPLRLNYLLEGSSPSNSESLGAQNQKLDSNDYEDCIDKRATKYLNRKDVQKALHAQLVGVANWTICSKVVKYDQVNREVPTIGIVGSLVRSGIRAVVYSGDQDTAVPFIGSRKLVDGLATQLKLNTTVPYKAWFENKQVGGWTQVYGDILTFATVRGASHATPTSQPTRSYLLFKSFLSGKPLPTEP